MHPNEYRAKRRKTEDPHNVEEIIAQIKDTYLTPNQADCDVTLTEWTLQSYPNATQNMIALSLGDIHENEAAQEAFLSILRSLQPLLGHRQKNYPVYYFGLPGQLQNSALITPGSLVLIDKDLYRQWLEKMMQHSVTEPKLAAGLTVQRYTIARYFNPVVQTKTVELPEVITITPSSLAQDIATKYKIPQKSLTLYVAQVSEKHKDSYKLVMAFGEYRAAFDKIISAISGLRNRPEVKLNNTNLFAWYSGTISCPNLTLTNVVVLNPTAVVIMFNAILQQPKVMKVDVDALIEKLRRNNNISPSLIFQNPESFRRIFLTQFTTLYNFHQQTIAKAQQPSTTIPLPPPISDASTSTLDSQQFQKKITDPITAYLASKGHENVEIILQGIQISSRLLFSLSFSSREYDLQQPLLTTLASSLNLPLTDGELPATCYIRKGIPPARLKKRLLIMTFEHLTEWLKTISDSQTVISTDNLELLALWQQNSSHETFNLSKNKTLQGFYSLADYVTTVLQPPSPQNAPVTTTPEENDIFLPFSPFVDIPPSISNIPDGAEPPPSSPQPPAENSAPEVTVIDEHRFIASHTPTNQKTLAATALTTASAPLPPGSHSHPQRIDGFVFFTSETPSSKMPTTTNHVATQPKDPASPVRSPIDSQQMRKETQARLAELKKQQTASTPPSTPLLKQALNRQRQNPGSDPTKD